MRRRLFIALAGILMEGSSLWGQDVTSSTPDLELSSTEVTPDDWTGRRARWTQAGLKFNFDATYVFQGVAAGGLAGPLFPAFSNEHDTGHTVSGDLRSEFDTGKAGWWDGGLLKARLQVRTGRSVVQRAGSVAAVNNDALFPNVEDKFDDTAFAISELTYRHTLSDTIAIYGGLLNTALGDENALAGSSLSHSHFLNFALLYSVVEDATVPHVALGGGLEFNPRENVSGSFSVFGSDETAGENPFRTYQGTTLATEWTMTHALAERTGAQTFGFLYGINELNTNIAADPRLVLTAILLDVPIPQTISNTWSFYYNAHQFVQGNEEGGWGVFARWGFSDGNPNFVKQNAALGLGGIGLLPRRDRDRWGLGTYLVDMSNEDLLKGLHVGNEVGGEVYYSIAAWKSVYVTFDAQVMDSAVPRVNRTWVFGMRTNYSY